MKDGPKWEKFSHASPKILRIDSSKPKSDLALISKWFKVHKFWYEVLTNTIYDECSSKYDSDFYGRTDNSHLLEDLIENSLTYYQKFYSKSDSNILNSCKQLFLICLFYFVVSFI